MFLGLNLNVWGTRIRHVHSSKRKLKPKVEKAVKPSFEDVYTSVLKKELKK